MTQLIHGRNALGHDGEMDVEVPPPRRSGRGVSSVSWTSRWAVVVSGWRLGRDCDMQRFGI